MTDTPAIDPNAPLVASEAAARLAQLTADTDEGRAWGAKLLAGDSATRAELRKLIEAKVAGPQGGLLDQIVDGAAPTPLVETLINGELSTTNKTSLAADLLDLGLSRDQVRGFFEGKPLSKEEYATVMQAEKIYRRDPEFIARYLKGGAEERRIFSLIAAYKARGVERANDARR